MARILTILTLLLLGAALQADDPLPLRPLRGEIEGKVVDRETRAPVAGASIEITLLQVRTESDGQGVFRFGDVPAGAHVLTISAAGYEVAVKTDIVVRPRRLTRLQVDLATATPRLEEEVTVKGQYFTKSEKAPASVYNFSAEEIRRAPGAYGDISRMVRMLPGTANAGDTRNELIVRGGNPAEAGFVVENFELPHLSHFPSMRSSGGYFSALNPDLIQDLDFFTGNFPAEYGDRLSSIMNIRLREGNPRRIEGQFDINLGVAGLVLEGPLPASVGSWLLSYRHSYLGLVEDLDIADFNGYSPRMADLQAKAVVNLGPRHRLTFLDLFGASGWIQEKTGEKNELDCLQHTAGVSWQYLWSEGGFSETSLWYTRTSNLSIHRQLDAESPFEQETGLDEAQFCLRHQSTWKASDRFQLHFGLQAKREQQSSHYLESRAGSDPAAPSEQSHWTTRTALFATGVWKPLPALSIALGLRADHSTPERSFPLSPRLSINLQFNSRWSFHGGFGVFRQPLSLLMPLILWSGDSREVRNPRCDHWVLGIEHLPNPSTKLSLEMYDKEYRSLPISPEYPELLPMDRRLYESSLLPRTLEYTGKAWARGFELFWQKKMSKRFTGMASLSFETSSYRAHSRKWHPRNYDTPLILNLALGYRLSRTWEVGVRWIYASGMPYTPYDLQKSWTQNRGIFDNSRTNDARLPDYSSVNLRVDKRFLFRRSNLALYLEVWNLLGRKNVFRFRWDRELRGVDAEYDLPRVPLLGLEYEF